MERSGFSHRVCQVWIRCILRNIAIDGVRTEYVFNVDVDFVPNVDATEHIMALTKAMPGAIGKDTKFMLVIPAFEFVSGAQQRDDAGYGSNTVEGASKGTSKKHRIIRHCSQEKVTVQNGIMAEEESFKLFCK